MLQKKHLSPKEDLTVEKLKAMFYSKVDLVDFEKAKRDVSPFIRNAGALNAWSPELFKQAFAQLAFDE